MAASSESTISVSSVGASSDFALPYAYEDDADDGVYRIQVGPNPASICLDDVNDDEEEDDDENRDDDETQTLWTHVYIPENEPAPYAESFNSESNGQAAIGEDLDEIAQPPV